MATVVYYNAIELHNVVTRQWDQEVQYDDSGTDLVFARYKLRFDGILHVQAGAGALSTNPAWMAQIGGAGPATLAGMYQTVRRRLEQPRGDLEVVIGGTTVLRVKPAGSNDPLEDRDNGPKPQGVSITQIAGSNLFRVSFTVHVALGECEQGAAGVVINNRWSVAESIDERFFTTRTIRGRLRLSSPRFAGESARPLIVPLLEAGFKRTRIEYTVAANGLDCEYVVEDRQVHTSSPYPAVKMSGTHTEATNDGVTHYADIAVRLEGSPEADKKLMLTQGMRVVMSRLNIPNFSGLNTDYMLEQAALVDHFGEQNMVEVRMRIRHQKENLDKTLANIRANIGSPIELAALDGVAYDRRVSRLPATWGYDPHGSARDPAAALLLLQCYLQSPCSQSHSIAQGDTEFDEQTGDDTQGTEITGTQAPGQLPQTDGDVIDETAKTNIYTLSRVESRYVTDQVRAALPIASDNANAASTAVVTLARGQCRRIVHVEAERVGAMPLIPAPVDTFEDGAIGGTLLRKTEMFCPPGLAADGATKLYRVETIYEYALTRPPEADESSRIGVLPHTGLTNDDTAVTRNDLYDDRLEV